LLSNTIFDEDVKIGGERLRMYYEYVPMAGVLV
jgi:hypothetical protein